MARKHKPRDRTAPSVYFVEEDTIQAALAAQGRRMILNTGRGDTRLSLEEAYSLRDDLDEAINRQVEVEVWEKAGDVPPKPTKGK